MRIPVMRGVIERRILVNYRVDPAVLAKILPAPFQPKTVGGFGIAGICLIRLAHLRPKIVPRWTGVSSENAAHRAAVIWDDDGTTREGVFIWRRDTNSRLSSVAGGRLFPGVHHHARFQVEESAGRIEVALRSDNSAMAVSVCGRTTIQWPSESVFGSCLECSAFFEAGSLGYSPSQDSSYFEGIELRCHNWRAEPLSIEGVRSSFFCDEAIFPQGSVEFDSALIMRNIEHEWHGMTDLCCDAM